VDDADAAVFSRPAYVWEGLPRDRIAVIPPCIDAFSPKNQPLEPAVADAILRATGILEDRRDGGDPTFARQDGTAATVDHPTAMHEDRRVPGDARLVTQVSRWDRLKDHVGVVRGFADHVRADGDVHLVLAGPSAESVTDDPEGGEVLEEVRAAVDDLPEEVRARVHLACVPMDDLEENAAIVNALQRRSDVVVQKSLAEGFGLTVAEAMWKARPVVGARVGGIQDQIEHGRTGLLVDPTDPADLGRSVSDLLEDDAMAEEIGRAARRRVAEEYLAPHHLTRYLELIERVRERRPDGSA
jgi:trehalose synthase